MPVVHNLVSGVLRIHHCTAIFSLFRANVVMRVELQKLGNLLNTRKVILLTFENKSSPNRTERKLIGVLIKELGIPSPQSMLYLDGHITYPCELELILFMILLREML